MYSNLAILGVYLVLSNYRHVFDVVDKDFVFRANCCLEVLRVTQPWKKEASQAASALLRGHHVIHVPDVSARIHAGLFRVGRAPFGGYRHRVAHGRPGSRFGGTA